MVSKRSFTLLVLTGLTVLFLIAGCKGGPGSLLVGVLSSLPSKDATETGTSSLADEQQNGYDRGLKKEVNRYHLTQASEGNQNDDVQSAVRKMIEEDEVAALLGATTDEATRRAASLANFFNVPMIIPGADGDSVLPANNMWVFRLNAPSSSYAEYIFGNVLSKINMANTAANDETELTIRLAVIYEQNTFGESAAVATANAAMEQNIEIVYYGSYSPGAKDTKAIKSLAEKVVSCEPDLVYIVSSNPKDAVALNFALQVEFGFGLTPAVLGQGNGFTSLEFQDAVNTDNVYILRQALDTANCPAKIDSIQSAQAYAAAYLLETAIKEADAGMSKEKVSVDDQLSARREMIRDALKELNIDAPCLGKVKFNKNGQNKEQRFEIFRVQNDEMHLINDEAFRIVIKEIAGRDELIIIE